MNPWILLAIVVAWVGSSVFAVSWGERNGRAACKAEQLTTQANESQQADQAASQAAAKVVERVVIHRKVIQEVQRDVASDPSQRECRSGPESLRLFNDAIPAEAAGNAASAPRGDVPASDAGD